MDLSLILRYIWKSEKNVFFLLSELRNAQVGYHKFRAGVSFFLHI